MKPYFSIIIPIIKINPHIINETLPAIARQTFGAYEVIIVVNEKTGNEKKLELKYSNLHIHFKPQILSPGEKRDFGASQAKGTILSFIDDDVAPSTTWLQHADDIFRKKPAVSAIGGPGILFPGAPLWEHVFDAMLCSWVGSGEYSYRFVPQKARFVDDYPAMNLMMKKDVFDKIGGFDNRYWPGEDSKLTHKYHSLENKKIYYHPSVMVYHHRRDNLLGHVIQHRNYGLTRGKFVAHGDKNSLHLMYTIPAFFTFYVLVLAILLLFVVLQMLPLIFVQIAAIGLYLYLIMLLTLFISIYAHREDLVISFLAIIAIPLTHLTYGSAFLFGYFRELSKMIFQNRIQYALRKTPKDYDWTSLVSAFRMYANPKSSVLEIGASNVKRTREIATYCKKIIGVELFPDRVPISTIKKVEYRQGNWETLSKHVSKESIDVAISSHVIEHVEKDLKAINELYAVIKLGGVALINTPNRRRLVRVIIELFTGEKKFPYEEHIREYTEEDLKKLLKKSKFKKFEIKAVVLGIHGGPLRIFITHIPNILRKYANFWEIHLFK